MKRKFKRIASLVLAMVMVFAMAMPAMAASTGATANGNTNVLTHQIVINSEPGHIYEAYQIFTGTVAYKGNEINKNNVLSDIAWSSKVDLSKSVDGMKLQDAIIGLLAGNGIGTAADVQDAGKVAEALAKASSDVATRFAETIEKYLDTPDATTGSAAGTGKEYTLEVPASGYYLIKDKDDSLTGNNADEAYTAFILEIVGDRTVTAKSESPSVEKEVSDDVVDDGTGEGNTWGKLADHQIGESFQFKLEATIPANKNFKEYETYQLKFTDAMSVGVTFDGIASVKIKAAGLGDNGITVTAEQYVCSATAPKAGGDWTLTIADVIALLGEAKDTVWGEQDITVEVIYNAHLNANAVIAGNHVAGQENNNKVYLEFSNNPNSEGAGDLGKTPEKEVFVFTFDMDNKKVDGDDDDPATNGLAGAVFQLYSATSGATATKKTGDALNMVYDAASHTYRLATPEEVTAGGTVDTVTTDDTGLFNFAGLDEGTYYLEETVAPPGYNLLENRIKIVVKVLEQNVDATGTAVTTYKITVDNTPIFDPEGTPEPSYDGTNDVVNHKGATLPETGGIGTTIFYVVGSVLVLAAVILLVTKRRMKD